MRGEPELTRLLAREAGACTGYDACPGPGGLLYNMDGYAMEWSRLPWMSVADWAYRAVAAAASDVVASGGVPGAILYSIGARSPREALEAARGVGEAARDLGAVVLKADYNRAREAWIDVAVVGEAARPVPRSGARPGDAVLQAGWLGYGLLERLALEGVIGVDEALEAGATPRRLPPPAGPIVAGYATAAADNSDGWGLTLQLIAIESHATIILEEARLHPSVAKVLEAHGLSPEELAPSSWEDYNIALTVPGERAGEALEACRRRGIPCWRVGRVVEGPARVIYMNRQINTDGWNW